MFGETLSICLLLIRGRHENRIAISSVSINDIILDISIYNAVVGMNCDFPYQVRMLSTPLIPLTKERLESVLGLEDLSYIPVRLKIEEDGKYRIIDGRHRIASAIIKGITTITVETVENRSKKCESCSSFSDIIYIAKYKEQLCLTCFTEQCCSICHDWNGENSICCL